MLVTGAIGAVVGGIGGAVYSQITNGEIHWEDVIIGAVIGGMAGLTGGAIAGSVFAGSVTASTGSVMAGLGTTATTVVSTSVQVTDVICSSVEQQSIDIPEYVHNAGSFINCPTTIWRMKYGLL